ncbi:hypothetical protein Malapachy_2201 [Malassezia pachydermatis]|uniref:Uncharacterized protein n=1 Tax=Malassezia pachydermatis TaxID=77020 RepID=A0A0M8MPK6_9BASI|nr:hypothetical protein Malapachy_2201 [Malassezia pachydermatis]KOS15768.1 hypothetical protein Malapachy_2201 [Malassezia pachydermatis]
MVRSPPGNRTVECQVRLYTLGSRARPHAMRRIRVRYGCAYQERDTCTRIRGADLQRSGWPPIVTHFFREHGATWNILDVVWHAPTHDALQLDLVVQRATQALTCPRCIDVRMIWHGPDPELGSLLRAVSIGLPWQHTHTQVLYRAFTYIASTYAHQLHSTYTQYMEQVRPAYRSLATSLQHMAERSGHPIAIPLRDAQGHFLPQPTRSLDQMAERMTELLHRVDRAVYPPSSFSLPTVPRLPTFLPPTHSDDIIVWPSDTASVLSSPPSRGVDSEDSWHTPTTSPTQSSRGV